MTSAPDSTSSAGCNQRGIPKLVIANNAAPSTSTLEVWVRVTMPPSVSASRTRPREPTR